MMDRRSFIEALASGMLVVSSSVRAELLGKVHRIGWFRAGEDSIKTAFWRAMRDLGWVEGSNIVVETRYAKSREELPRLAADLVRSHVDVVLADSTAVALAAKTATSSIPIVFVVGADPVASGLVATLAHPAGNVTGFVYGVYEEKMLETLKAAVPGMSRVAVPNIDTGYPFAPGELMRQRLLVAASELGVDVTVIETRGPEALESFFETARKRGAEGVLVPNVPMLNPLLGRVGAQSTRFGFPAVGPFRNFVSGGGLICYGPADQSWQRVAFQIDKILRGAKPGNLPVERPTRFTTMINVGAARTLGLALPQWLLLSADEIFDS